MTSRLVGGPSLDDPNADLRLRVRRRESTFSRFYHPRQLAERVLAASGLQHRVFFIENPEAVGPRCYLKFALLLERPADSSTRAGQVASRRKTASISPSRPR
ncbi:MAG: hypothetical protein CL910_17985 [Deltaproteobacteria bacterium]|nr:hypothetical protein [Deltaproteobacteria bacterium]